MGLELFYSGDPLFPGGVGNTRGTERPSLGEWRARGW
jgi:hypothetical protein